MCTSMAIIAWFGLICSACASWFSTLSEKHITVAWGKMSMVECTGFFCYYSASTRAQLHTLRITVLLQPTFIPIVRLTINLITRSVSALHCTALNDTLGTTRMVCHWDWCKVGPMQKFEQTLNSIFCLLWLVQQSSNLDTTDSRISVTECFKTSHSRCT